MSQAGYTLVETLAAMAVISLAMGGLLLGVQVLAPSQLATGKTAAKLQVLRNGQARLERLLARGAPFDSADPSALTGDARSVRFACAAPQPCRAELSGADAARRLELYDGRSAAPALTLAAPDDARLAYQGTWTADDRWPPAAPRSQALRSVLLLAGAAPDAPPLLVARVWREQTADCAFDPISGSCRR